MKETNHDHCCFHCDLPLPKGVSFASVVNGEERQFCCNGCQSIAEMILEQGGAEYYRRRTSHGAQAKTSRDKSVDFTFFDDPAVQSSFVISECGPTGNDRKENTDAAYLEAELIIPDMHCAACCWLIERALSQFEAVDQCKINLTQQKLFVRWQKDNIKLSQVFERLHQIGYSAKPFSQEEVLNNYATQRRVSLKRLGLAGIITMQVMMCSFALYAGAFEGIEESYQQLLQFYSLILTTLLVAYSARPFISSALKSLRAQQANMDLPITIAITSAYLTSLWVTLHQGQETYFESICMFVFFLLIARHIELTSRFQNVIWTHDPLLPATCTTIDKEGQHLELLLALVKPGDCLLIRQGETIPVDGDITHGTALIDESSVTGEFIPVKRTVSQGVLAGTINTEGVIHILCTKPQGEHQLSHIRRLADKATSEATPLTHIADAIAAKFSIGIIFSAALTGLYCQWAVPDEAFSRLLAVLVISCPCALSLATPAAITVASRALQRSGLYVVKPHVLEQLQHITHIVFDKTGTLTNGNLTIDRIELLDDSRQLDQNTLLTIARTLESVSEHPIANAFLAKQDTLKQIDNIIVTPGEGIEGVVEGQAYRIGDIDFCQSWMQNISTRHLGEQSDYEGSAKRVFLSNNEQLLCCFFLNDSLRDGAQTLVQYAHQLNLTSHILSGDNEQHSGEMGALLNISHIRASAKPADKIDYINQLAADDKKVLVLGDGVNDAPILAGGHLSIAMPSASDFTKAQADIILANPSLTSIVALFEHANKTRSIIRQNLTWALAYNITAIPLAAMGLLPPYLAALGMSLSSILVIANATRLKSTSKINMDRDELTRTNNTPMRSKPCKASFS